MQQNSLGTIAYEITNYPPVVGRSFGNVNVVFSDRKLWIPATNTFKAFIVLERIIPPYQVLDD